MGGALSSKLSLYLNTVSRMRPGMVVSRLRGMRRLPAKILGEPRQEASIPLISIAELDCDDAFASRFDIDGLSTGFFRIINEVHAVDLATWGVPEASHLWNFNLHYFEYCVPLAARYAKRADSSDWDTFRRLLESWMDCCVYPNGDAWHPYTISLRLVNWLICLDLFGEIAWRDKAFTDRLLGSMYVQYRHLLLNQEKHLLANHYFENIKTLLICSAMFGERDVYAVVSRDLEKQLEEQVLPDGVHYERSLMYHKLIIEGLLRVELAAHGLGYPLPGCMRNKEQLMLDAMASLEKGMGKTPFFNDSADGVAKECECLVIACRSVLGLAPDDSKTDFHFAGYYKLYCGDAALMVDAGEPGPRFMLGHAHCDCLSYELSLKGEPVVVNSGTYAYQSELRSYFRSTEAHNALVINDEEQLECWGEHRVARGYRKPWARRVGASAIEAGYTSRGGRNIRRRFEMTESRLVVLDEVDGAPTRLCSYIHFVPFGDRHLSVSDGSTGDSSEIEQKTCRLSAAFGCLSDAPCVTVKRRLANRIDYVVNFG